jgi:hypothetical protein
MFQIFTRILPEIVSDTSEMEFFSVGTEILCQKKASRDYSEYTVCPPPTCLFFSMLRLTFDFRFLPPVMTTLILARLICRPSDSTVSEDAAGDSTRECSAVPVRIAILLASKLLLD